MYVALNIVNIIMKCILLTLQETAPEEGFEFILYAPVEERPHSGLFPSAHASAQAEMGNPAEVTPEEQ
jgi:hypothetical protein